MKLSEYKKYDGVGLAELIRNKDIKPQEAITAAIKLAQELNPELNAITQWFEELAWEKFEQSDESMPLYGVPCLLKDLGFPLEGTVDSMGSPILNKFISPKNNDYVNALLKTGLIPFAKTNAPEFGLSFDTESELFGRTNNPLNKNIMVGGSSGGSAAAVAAGIVPIATANDGGGSIRVPAGCCGLFGLKPSTGITPVGPDFPELWSGFVASHVLTRSVRDSGLMLDLIHTNKARGNYFYASQQFPAALNIAVMAESSVPVDKHYLKALDTMSEQLSIHGHVVEAVKPNLDFEAIGEQAMTIIAANTAALLSLFNEQQLKTQVHPFGYEFYRRGLEVSARRLIIARNDLYQLYQPLRDIFDNYDVIMTPAFAQPPLKAGEMHAVDNFERYLEVNNEFSPFTGIFNHTGMPAMTVPLKQTLNNIPLSVQFAADWGQEEMLLKLANQLLQN